MGTGARAAAFEGFVAAYPGQATNPARLSGQEASGLHFKPLHFPSLWSVSACPWACCMRGQGLLEELDQSPGALGAMDSRPWLDPHPPSCVCAQTWTRKLYQCLSLSRGRGGGELRENVGEPGGQRCIEGGSTGRGRPPLLLGGLGASLSPTT